MFMHTQYPLSSQIDQRDDSIDLSIKRILIYVVLLLEVGLIACGCESSKQLKSDELSAQINQVNAMWDVSINRDEHEGKDSNTLLDSEGHPLTLAITKGRLPLDAQLRTASARQASINLGSWGSLYLDQNTAFKVHKELNEEGRHVLEITDGRVIFIPKELNAEHNLESIWVQTPHGAFLLDNTKISLSIEEVQSVVSIARGQISLNISGNHPLKISAGESLIFTRNQAPHRAPALQLGASMSWFSMNEIGQDQDKITQPIQASNSDSSSDSSADSSSDSPAHITTPKSSKTSYDKTKHTSTPKHVKVTRGLGTLFAQIPGGGAPLPLKVKRRSIKVKISDAHAYTEVTEVFKNPSSATLEGIYRFQLPPHAQISRLALLVNGRLQEGVFVENKRAEKIWREIISQRRDPAMLTWKHGQTFELKIFPINGHSTRQVTIGYTTSVTPCVGGRCYLYPMPMDHAGEQATDRFELKVNITGAHPTSPVSVSGLNAQVTQEADQVKIIYSADHFSAQGDLRIRYALPPMKNSIQATGYRDKNSASNYVSLKIKPTLKQQTQRAPHDVILIADHSYHRLGGALQLQAQLFKHLVGELDPTDRILVLGCATQCTRLGTAHWTYPAPLVTQSVSEGV